MPLPLSYAETVRRLRAAVAGSAEGRSKIDTARALGIKASAYRHWAEAYDDPEAELARLEAEGPPPERRATEVAADHVREWLADSPGVGRRMAEAGVGPAAFRHGWIKDDEGSYFIKVPPQDQADMADGIRAALDGYEPPSLPEPSQPADASLLTLFGVMDLHMGMRSWARETGENYDLREAERIAIEGAADLVARSPNAGTAILLFGGDNMHADDDLALTPASKHPLDVDGRFAKVAETMVATSVQMVDLLRQKFPRVVVRILRGNHDPHAAAWLSICLGWYYRDVPAVHVIDDPHEFLFYRHGATLIAAHHGHRRQMKDIAGAIPALRPDDWGATRFRYYFQGHVHHERMGIEHNGVVCRALSPITAKDAWASGMGFSAGRSMSALTFHDRLGLWGEARHPILPPPMGEE